MNIRGESYRLKDKRQAGLYPSQRYITPSPEETGPARTTDMVDGH